MNSWLGVLIFLAGLGLGLLIAGFVLMAATWPDCEEKIDGV